MSARRALKILMACMACAALAAATSVIPISLQQLTQRASTVVEARAQNSWSQWNPQHTLIFTYTRFAVMKALKGETPQTIVVRQMGGKVGTLRQTVAGVRSWRPGEESMLFLRPSAEGNGVMAIVGLMQGDFRITRTATGVTASNGVPQSRQYDVKQYQRGSATPEIYTGEAMPLRQLESQVAGMVAK